MFLVIQCISRRIQQASLRPVSLKYIKTFCASRSETQNQRNHNKYQNFTPCIDTFDFKKESYKLSHTKFFKILFELNKRTYCIYYNVYIIYIYVYIYIYIFLSLLLQADATQVNFIKKYSAGLNSSFPSS